MRIKSIDLELKLKRKLNDNKKICDYVKIYYCHRYNSYKIGTSENQHKLVNKKIYKKGEEIGK